MNNIENWLFHKGWLEYVSLLDSRHHNEFLRAFAVKKLESMTDQELLRYLPFILLGVCYEPELYNPLTEFVIERSVKNMQYIGMQTYWILRSWLHWKPYHVKFMLICEQIVFLAGSARRILLEQQKVCEMMKEAAIKALSSKDNKRSDGLKEFFNARNKRLASMSSEQRDLYQFPHDYTLQSNAILGQYCKSTGRKKTSITVTCPPLARGLPNFAVTYRFQEEVCQDMFCHRLMQMFDHCWLERGLDLKIITPKVTPVDDLIGFAQVFDNSESLSNIYQKYGTGLSELDKNCILKFIEANNKNVGRDNAQEVFRRSLAGYCVGTYVLGVVEKSYDFYTITENGTFFHNSFGMELFGGADRDDRDKIRVAFTKEMEAVIDPNLEEYFFGLCNAALIVLRKQAHQLLNLMRMMLLANLPGYQVPEALTYVRNSLNLSGSDADACQNFKLVMERSLATDFRKAERVGKQNANIDGEDL